MAVSLPVSEPWSSASSNHCLRTISDCVPILKPAGPFEWKNIRHDFDYVWAYRVPGASPSLAAIGKIVYQDTDLLVYQLN